MSVSIDSNADYMDNFIIKLRQFGHHELADKLAATSGPDYNVTGNEAAAGGTSVVPWSTRNKKLLEFLKKKRKKEST